jgi:hypothetical protein
MEFMILTIVVAFIIGAGIYLSEEGHPTDPHQEHLMGVARQCLAEDAQNVNMLDELGHPEPLENHEQGLRGPHLV